MTDLGTPSTDRSEAVARVISAISSGAADGELGRDALRDALASEGQSLTDLPEVGLWMALTQISLTESPGTPLLRMDDQDRLVIDLVDAPPPDAAQRVELPRRADVDRDERVETLETVVTAETVEPVETADAIETDQQVGTDQVDEPRTRRRRRMSRRRRLPDKVVLEPPPTTKVTLPVPEDAPAPPLPSADDLLLAEVAAQTASLRDHLAEHLDAATGRLRLPDPTVSGGARIEPTTRVRLTRLRAGLVLQHHLAAVLDHPPDVRLPDPATPGTARPEPFWPQHELNVIRALDAHLRDRLGATDLALGAATPPDVPPPSDHRPVLEPYWPPALVHRLEGIDAFLASLGALPTGRRVPASRQACASNGASPDPYWPRHLLRTLDREPDLPVPRSADALEAALRDELDTVHLIGDADLAAAAAEMEVSLAQLVRRLPLDRLGRLYPATLAGFLVHHTMQHPSDAAFDAAIPVRSLRRTNQVGLAFSEALVRLGKPVFREVEQRADFDRRVRYQRRMELHGGIGPDSIAPAVAAISDSHWAGAVSGREVAQDWLVASGSVAATIGEPALRLLTATDHGARMLDALLALVQRRWIGASYDPPDTSPLPPALVGRATALLDAWEAPTRSWGEPSRPRLRLARTPGGGPELELPRSPARWLLNGELLGYGSPSQHKTVELPPSRGGRWLVSTGSTRRSSPDDIRVTSATPDRSVLVFDELGRHHHRSLPIGGRVATIIAPAGSVVPGETDRTLLVGRWVGFERITVELGQLVELTVGQRGRETLVVPVDHRLDARVTVTDAGTGTRGTVLVTFAGHVPVASQVEVIVADGRGRPRPAMLSDARITYRHGTFALDRLVDSPAAHDLTVRLERHGCEPVTTTVRVERRTAARAVPPRADVLRSLAPLVDADPGTDADARVPAGDLDDLWVAEPIAGAVRDRWSGADRERQVAAAERWLRHTGWAPPASETHAPGALRSLFAPLVEAISTAPPTDAPTGPPLLAAAWRTGLDTEGPDLAEWHRRHRRALTQWRSTTPHLRHVEQLWSRLHRDGQHGLMASLVTAALLSAADGPHRHDALGRVVEAVGLAPTLGTSAVVLAAAYAEIVRSHPPVRFIRIDIPDGRRA